jgi:AraC-like DNA-binding protein
MQTIESQNISPKRQNTESCRILAKTHFAGSTLPSHQHSTGQMLFATQGVMLVETAKGRWTVPPQRALWIPPHETHAIEMLTETHMRTVYFSPDLIAGCNAFTQHSKVHVVVASAMIKELVLGLFETERSDDMRDLMAKLLLHALVETTYLPTYLPMPTEEKLKNTLLTLIAKNDWQQSLDEVSARSHMSSRTFTRRFTLEVGMSFRDWRQRARLVKSLDLLALNQSIKSIAHTMGFASTSAYCAAFRDLLGCIPSEFRPIKNGLREGWAEDSVRISGKEEKMLL